MAHDVFLCYSSRDRLTVDAVRAVLEAAGIRCWVAPRDVLPGADWGESIIDAISCSRAMVLVFSGNANSSPQVRREVERAVNKGVPIVPFRIEDVLPTKSLEYFISTSHWLDAFVPPLDRHLDYLAEVLGSILNGPDKSEPEVNPWTTVVDPPAAVDVPYDDARSDKAPDLGGAHGSRWPLIRRLTFATIAGLVALRIVSQYWDPFPPRPDPVTPPNPEANQTTVAPTAFVPVKPVVATIQPPPRLDPVASSDAGANHATVPVAVPAPARPVIATTGPATEAELALSGPELYSRGYQAYNWGHYAEAIHLYLLAVGKGNSDSMHQLGGLYENGFGVERDFNLARTWYQSAADHGAGFALYNIAVLYMRGGPGMPRDMPECIRRLKQIAASSDYTNSSAAWTLGRIYRDGDGVGQDGAKAAFWFRQATDKAKESR